MLGTQQEFDFGQSSNIYAANLGEDAYTAGVARLHEMLRDSDVQPAEISRHIALLIVEVIRNMTANGSLRQRGHQRILNERVKALREVQKSLIEGAASSRRDVLNLDGPKFKFFFGQMVMLFQEALKDSGVDAGLAKNVMLQFGDLIKANGEGLRRNLNQITA
jgi:hypothetical protein